MLTISWWLRHELKQRQKLINHKTGYRANVILWNLQRNGINNAMMEKHYLFSEVKYLYLEAKLWLAM